MFVTSVASGLRVIHFMAIQAAVHGGGAGQFRHRLDLPDLAVAGLAGYAGLEMHAVIPRHARQHGINANPGNRLLGLRILGELLNRNLVLRNRHMAQHAFAGVRECHQFARLGIRVTVLSIQTERQMFLVAVRDGLRGRRVVRRIVRDHLLRRLR